MDYIITPLKKIRIDEILPLYEKAGWSSYTSRPEMLKAAYENSLAAFSAWEGERLVGLLRAVGDGHSVVFVQDILVLPEFRRRGIGTALFCTLTEAYPDVYQLHLMCDDIPELRDFYTSLGLDPVTAAGCVAFTRIRRAP